MRLAMTIMALALTSCSPAAEEEAAAPPVAVPVSTAVVEPAPGAGEIRASATLGFLREPSLAFRVGGVIAGIAVQEGDFVRRGQRLAWLEPTDVAAGAAEARAALANAEADLARAEALFARGHVAQARVDAARLAVERAKAGAATAVYAAENAEIKASADGIVLRRLAEPRQVAAPGAPVLTIGETGSGLVARAALPAGRAAQVSVGDRASLQVADVRVEPFAGRVARLSGQADAATGAVDVEVAIDQPQGLRSGLVGEIFIAPARVGPAAAAPQAVQVPTLALLDARADQGVVFVVDETGAARRRAVRTGGVDGEVVLVLEGLAPGEKVIASGAAYLRDGDMVQERP